MRMKSQGVERISQKLNGQTTSSYSENNLVVRKREKIMNVFQTIFDSEDVHFFARF